MTLAVTILLGAGTLLVLSAFDNVSIQAEFLSILRNQKPVGQQVSTAKGTNASEAQAPAANPPAGR